MRISFDAPELVGTVHESALIAEAAGYKVYRIRWPVLADPCDDGAPDFHSWRRSDADPEWACRGQHRGSA